MAQRRMLPKDISESDSFGKINNSRAQLLCCLLTPWWDDHGKMIGDEKWIKGNIVRKLKQFTEKEILRCLKLIDKNTDVHWWQDDMGNKWLYWPKFDKYQTISQEKKTKDRLPSPKIPKNPQETPSTTLTIRELKDNYNYNLLYVDFEKSTFNNWNEFCNKHPRLSRIKEITDTRRKHLKARFEKESFRDFPGILKAIEQQPFLITGSSEGNHKNWKISFDWLVENDTNYIKVIEMRYKNNPTGDVQAADPDCLICNGSGWDETRDMKKLCQCRLVKKVSNVFKNL